VGKNGVELTIVKILDIILVFSRQLFVFS
jgi:hypothetical protein